MKQVYIAGPLFSDQDRMVLETLTKALEGNRVSCFLPHRDAGDLVNLIKECNGDVKLAKKLIFKEDYKAVKYCTILTAMLDGTDVDSGTAVEIGLAHEMGKHIIGYHTDARRRNGRLNNMIESSCTIIHDNVSDVVKSVLNIVKG